LGDGTEIETVPDLDHLVHRLNQLAAVMFGVDGLAAAEPRAVTSSDLGGLRAFPICLACGAHAL
jgi:hypothetical protein